MSGKRPRAVPGLLALGAALCLAFGCGDEPELLLVTPDRASFEAEVYPVLLRDCGFHACHGSTERFFQVFGPGRRRLNAAIKPLDPAAPEEIAQSYERARSMLDGNAIQSSLLLRKPLATEAGGMGHEGADDLGRNVYESKADPGYDVLTRWATTTAPAQSTPRAL